MPRKRLIAVPLLLAPSLLLAAESRRVEVVAQVALVTQIECPAMLELAPGETRQVIVRVACNQPWLLAVQTDNALVHSAGHHTGSAGGLAATSHTFVVTLTCSPDADGPQRTALVTQLVSGPLVAGLRH